MDDDQIITIKEARKLLEGEAKQLSDAKVEELINELDFIATIAIRNKAEKAEEGKENGDDQDQTK